MSGNDKDCFGIILFNDKKENLIYNINIYHIKHFLRKYGWVETETKGAYSEWTKSSPIKELCKLKVPKDNYYKSLLKNKSLKYARRSYIVELQNLFNAIRKYYGRSELDLCRTIRESIEDKIPHNNLFSFG